MAHRSRNSGRRGRKQVKGALREKKKRDTFAKAQQVEHERRRHFIKDIIPWVEKMCPLSEDGIIVEKTVEGRYPHPMWFAMYCAEGYILSSVIDVHEVRIGKIERWADINSDRLKRLKKRDWKPFRPKCVLQRLADI